MHWNNPRTGKRTTYLELKTADGTRDMMYLHAFCKMNYFVKNIDVASVWILTLEGSFGFCEGQALEIFIFAIQKYNKRLKSHEILDCARFQCCSTLTVNCNQFMLMFPTFFGSATTAVRNDGSLLWRMVEMSQLYFCDLWMPSLKVINWARGAEKDQNKMIKIAQHSIFRQIC